MPEKDFFDCGPASFYNCRVLKTNEIVGGLALGILLFVRWKMNARLPLTPALSLWERENRFQCIGISRRSRWADALPAVAATPEPLELPRGFGVRWLVGNRADTALVGGPSAKRKRSVPSALTHRTRRRWCASPGLHWIEGAKRVKMSGKFLTEGAGVQPLLLIPCGTRVLR
ncbi:MAG: hypothetical protein NT154_27100 [Verrucomicrobia bacterium]|nr:hypothetical protein [Verrucomicrobiota bacterium]